MFTLRQEREMKTPESDRHRRTKAAQRKARIVKNNRTPGAQASRPSDWSLYIAEARHASASFMEEVEDLSVQERKAHPSKP
jgi:hypothetical protein